MTSLAISYDLTYNYHELPDLFSSLWFLRPQPAPGGRILRQGRRLDQRQALGPGARASPAPDVGGVAVEVGPGWSSNSKFGAS